MNDRARTFFVRVYRPGFGSELLEVTSATMWDAIAEALEGTLDGTASVEREEGGSDAK